MMRFVAILSVLLSFAFLDFEARAQDKKDKDKDTQVLEVAGKSLEEWIREMGNRDPSRAERAIRAIMQFSPIRAYKALPYMLIHMRKHSRNTLDISLRVNFVMAVGGIINANEDVDPSYVKEAVTLLRMFMNDRQAIVRYRAAEALGKIGPDAKSAVPELLANLREQGTWEIRQASALALAQVAYDKKNGPSPQIMNALYNCLRDPASAVRLAGVQALTFLGTPSDPTVKVLFIKALEPVAVADPEPTVQIWANMAIMGATEEINAERVSTIVKMFNHPELPVRLQAIQAIGVVGPKAKGAIVPLTANLANEEPSIVLNSIYSLARMEAWASEVVPQLQKIADDPDRPELIKNAASSAIDRIKGRKKAS